MSRIPLAMRILVARRARNLCEYCRSAEENTGQDFFIDHVVAESRGGTGSSENLAWCCFWCNCFKQARGKARDPQTGDIVRLFNPRQDDWSDHFRWTRDGLTIIGQTSIGRATVEALRLNRPNLVRGRRGWVSQGRHPPKPK